MFLANLSLGEFIALLGAATGLTVALYLLSRTRRKHIVSTLKFWRTSLEPVQSNRRRRIDQPWSLVLQLISIALLLLAIAQPKWGSRDSGARDHVLLIDTSSWMGARGVELQTKQAALRWLRGLPAQDRVMIVRAGALPETVTRFESERVPIEAAIRDSHPGSGALDLGRAVEFARQAFRVQAGRTGEIVYCGGGRIEGAPPASAQGLRWLSVDLPKENLGLTKVALRRTRQDGGLWSVFLTVHNYGPTPRSAAVALVFGGAPAGSRTLTVPARGDAISEFGLRTNAAGIVEARLLTGDALPADDHVAIEIPAQKPLRIAVYSDEPALLRPVLAAEPRLNATFLPAAAYQPKPDADLLLLDGVKTAAPPQLPALWIPAPGASPVPVARSTSDAVIASWQNDHPLAAGLRTRDAKVGTALIFRPDSGDTVVASSDEGPLLVARNTGVKLAVFGFHPFHSPLQYELAAPLLMANFLAWVAPESFLHTDVVAGTVGPLSVEIPPAEAASVRVVAEGGATVPFTIDGNQLRLFAPLPGTLRVLSPGSERVFSLSLPQVASTNWDAPPQVVRGQPPRSLSAAIPRELWHWFALLGALGLLAEWLLFGKSSKIPHVLRRAA